MNKQLFSVVWLEAIIYTALPALAVFSNAAAPFDLKTYLAAISAALIGLKAFISTTVKDAKDSLAAPLPIETMIANTNKALSTKPISAPPVQEKPTAPQVGGPEAGGAGKLSGS